MGGSGKWMKVFIGQRKSEKEDHVSSNFGVFILFLFLLTTVLNIQNGDCLFVFYRRSWVVLKLRNGGYGGAHQGI